MTTWSIEPRDTLVLGDGRPNLSPGIPRASLPLPYPSTLAGFLRTQSALDTNGHFKYENNEPACLDLMKTSVIGPWLGLRKNHAIEQQYVPAPLDAICYDLGDQSDRIKIIRLGRQEKGIKPGEHTCLPDGLQPLFPSNNLPSDQKPIKGPTYWSLDFLQRWLISPQNHEGDYLPDKIGLGTMAAEERIGVKIDPETQTGEEGLLYSNQHRRFVDAAENVLGYPRLSNAKRLCILAQCNQEGIQEGIVPFAGERRLVYLSKTNLAPPPMPETILKQIVDTGALRVVLLTPGFFKNGWKPDWLLTGDGDLSVRLQSAVSPRPLVVSGWDFLHRRPKPSKRLAPAGSVYYLQLEGPTNKIEQWAKNHWWKPVSDPVNDKENPQRDGFGLCVLGADEPII